MAATPSPLTTEFLSTTTVPGPLLSAVVAADFCQVFVYMSRRLLHLRATHYLLRRKCPVMKLHSTQRCTCILARKLHLDSLNRPRMIFDILMYQSGLPAFVRAEGVILLPLSILFDISPVSGYQRHKRIRSIVREGTDSNGV